MSRTKYYRYGKTKPTFLVEGDEKNLKKILCDKNNRTPTHPSDNLNIDRIRERDTQKEKRERYTGK